MFINTTHSTGRQLRNYQRTANTQESRILEFFEDNKNQAFTPSDVCRLVFENDVPITSVRRGITELTNDGQLSKTNQQVTGPWGKPEYKWKLASGQLSLL